MTGNEKIREQLAALLEQGSLPKSTCSGSLLKFLKPLLDSGVVAEERSGAGRRLVVHNAGAVQIFCKTRFPETAISTETPSRIAGVALFSDSKTHPNDVPEIVCVRCFAPGTLRRDGQKVEAASATEENGVFAFVLQESETWSVHGVCALVENPAVFLALESLELKVELAIHGRGRSSNQLLNWLATQTDEQFQLWHLPDYDPTGLDEFERVRARLGPRAQLYLPAQLPDLFRRFSKRDLLANPHAQTLLAKLRSSDSAEVRRVVALIDLHNAGLEHEALLIKMSPS